MDTWTIIAQALGVRDFRVDRNRRSGALMNSTNVAIQHPVLFWSTVVALLLLLYLLGGFKQMMEPIDLTKLEAEIAADLAKERAAKAKLQLREKLLQIQKTEQILANLLRDLDDLKASIADGTN